MALHSISSAAALPIALATIPSLPRPLLKRLVERAIDRLDELDGDPDLEDGDEDRCPAGDDSVVAHVGQALAYNSEDSEDAEAPAFMLDQRDARFEVQIPPRRREAA